MPASHATHGTPCDRHIARTAATRRHTATTYGHTARPARHKSCHPTGAARRDPADLPHAVRGQIRRVTSASWLELRGRNSSQEAPLLCAQRIAGRAAADVAPPQRVASGPCARSRRVAARHAPRRMACGTVVSQVAAWGGGGRRESMRSRRVTARRVPMRMACAAVVSQVAARGAGGGVRTRGRDAWQHVMRRCVWHVAPSYRG